jgi:hypothetical protein
LRKRAVSGQKLAVALFNDIFLTILELFLLAFVPLLNRAEEPTYARVNFGFGTAFG